MNEKKSSPQSDSIRSRSKEWESETILEVDASINSTDSTISSRMRWKVVVKKNTEKNRKLPNGYLGVLQRAVAEKKLGMLKFAVYHQLPMSPVLKNMTNETTLACVFKSSRNIFTHFPICEHINDKHNAEYFVDTGSSKSSKKFASIENLVEHYCG